MAETMKPGKEKVILPVTGMTCASYVAAIEKGLSQVPGVSRVSVTSNSLRLKGFKPPRLADAQPALIK